MKKIYLLTFAYFLFLNVYGQQITRSSILLNENRTLTVARNWAIRQNNTNEGDLQIGCTNSNTGGLPDFYLNPELAKLTIKSSGNILIGKVSQVNSGYILDVNGKIRANEVVVNMTGADFVFDSNYQLYSLSDLEKYININKHLPGLKPASEMQIDGMGISELNTKLIQKIEELTLYTIAQNKKIIELEKQDAKIQYLEEKIKELAGASK